MQNIARVVQALRESGLSFVEIGKRMGCSASCVNNVHKGVAEPSCSFIMRLISVAAQRAKELEKIKEDLEKVSKSNRSF